MIIATALSAALIGAVSAQNALDRLGQRLGFDVGDASAAECSSETRAALALTERTPDLFCFEGDEPGVQAFSDQLQAALADNEFKMTVAEGPAADYWRGDVKVRFAVSPIPERSHWVVLAHVEAG